MDDHFFNEKKRIHSSCHSKLIRKVNVGNKTVPVLEENMGELLYNLYLGKLLKLCLKNSRL